MASTDLCSHPHQEHPIRRLIKAGWSNYSVYIGTTSWPPVVRLLIAHHPTLNLKVCLSSNQLGSVKLQNNEDTQSLIYMSDNSHVKLSALHIGH